jgi:CheY-like chemotaxis protein
VRLGSSPRQTGRRTKAAAMRILIVDDERKLAGLLCHGLEEYGYAVD